METYWTMKISLTFLEISVISNQLSNWHFCNTSRVLSQLLFRIKTFENIQQGTKFFFLFFLLQIASFLDGGN